MSYNLPFNAHQDGILRRLWADPTLATWEVAARMNRCGQTIRNRAARLGLGEKAYTAKPTGFWTEERENRLRELHAEGHSYSEIARRLGAPTRNTVCGKAHRLGLSARPAASKPPLPKRVPNPPRRPAVRSSAWALQAAGATAPTQLQAEPAARGDTRHAKVWTERAFGECAFPIDGNGAGTRSCCAPSGAHTYCKAHRRVVYVKPRNPIDKLAKWAERVAA